jgi:hypothetical protein
MTRSSYGINCRWATNDGQHSTRPFDSCTREGVQHVEDV